MRAYPPVALASVISLALTAGAMAQTESMPAYVPAQPPQAAMDRPSPAGPAARAQQAPAAVAEPAPADRIKALAGIRRGRDGQTRRIGVPRKVRAMILGKVAQTASQATRILTFEKIENTAQYPFSTIGLLGNGCTGTLIGKHFVLTAGYCIYDSQAKKWYDNLDFWPALNGQSQPYGGVKWKNAWVPQGYVDTGAADYDYGLIELQSDIGDKAGWFGFGFDNDFPHRHLALTAYPNGVPEFTMWQAQCPLKKAAPSFLTFTCPIKTQMQGGWGAPVWVKGKAGDSWTVYGIYMGTDGTGYWANRITRPIYETLVSWMKPPEEQPPIGDAGEEEEEE